MASAFQSVLPDIVGFPVPKMLRGILGKLLGLDNLERVHAGLQSTDESRSIVDRLLDFLSVRCAVSDADLARIPRNGGAIVTVNHPFGLLDGAVIASILGQV